MDLGLKGKTALVLASSTGLGKAVAEEFAREKANVMMFSPFGEELASAQSEIKEMTGCEPGYFVGSMTNYEDIKEVVKHTRELYGTVDILFNNTGGPPAGTFDNFSDEQWQQAYELTLLSFIRSIREVLPLMKKQKFGRIVNSTSSSIKRVLDNLILSNTFRMGVMGLSKTISQEVAADNILINVMGPGRIATARVEELDKIRAKKQGISYEEIRLQTERQIPLGRYGTPEEYAKLAVFLCSEANTYITGQSILVDGGLVTAF